jgi:hypothetical protein
MSISWRKGLSFRMGSARLHGIRTQGLGGNDGPIDPSTDDLSTGCNDSMARRRVSAPSLATLRLADRTAPAFKPLSDLSASTEEVKTKAKD